MNNPGKGEMTLNLLLNNNIWKLMEDYGHKKSHPKVTYFSTMVPKAGLEPARISTVDFESTASTDFATSALKGMRKRSGLYLSAAVMQATACRHCAKC